MTEEKKSYRVTDRRHSTIEQEEPETEKTETSESRRDHPGVQSAEPPPVDFTAFVMSLGAQASLLLGGVEGAEPDLKGARWLISILEMLRDKTEGRRTAAETEALEAILYELRMRFVEQTRAGGA